VCVRPVILPLGLDLEPSVQPSADSRLATELRDVSERPTVLYLSRIAPKKCLDVLLRAFALTVAEHPTATLLIAGDGPPELVAGYQRVAVDLGLSSGQVRWLGFVQGADKHWLLRHASLFVLPSKSENFGVAAAEAIAAGLPVVLTRGVALAELTDEARCGIVTGGTADETHRAMSMLLGNAEMRSEMGLAGRRFAAEFLSLDAFGKRLEELYHQVIAESPARSGHVPRPGTVGL
jgi:glycosyltransferase involved in cell wall biosynthesis